jgi:hypothetical protein
MRNCALRGCLKDNLIRTIIVATLLIIAAIFAGGPYGQPGRCEAENHAYPSASSEEPPKTFWEKTADDPVAAFTAMLTAFTAVLATVAIIQIYFLTKSDENTRIAAEAAKTSAEAALAALDRPWLFVDTATHNKQAWASCNDELFAKIKISNYGKAPAFVNVVKAVLFLGLTPLKAKDFPVHPLPEDIQIFPNESELRGFIGKHGRQAFIDDDSPDKTEGTINKPLTWAVAIAPNGDSKSFYFKGPKKLTSFVKGIPIQMTCGLYLIGWAIYYLPGNEAEVMNFCYEGGDDGSFRFLFGPPYNERKKIEG